MHFYVKFVFCCCFLNWNQLPIDHFNCIFMWQFSPKHWILYTNMSNPCLSIQKNCEIISFHFSLSLLHNFVLRKWILVTKKIIYHYVFFHIYYTNTLKIGAEFCSLYCEIHYIEVRYIEVLVNWQILKREKSKFFHF